MVMALATTAQAGSCPVDMAKIDAALPGASLSASDMEKVKKLRETGAKLHGSGDHAGSVKALGEALKLLGK